MDEDNDDISDYIQTEEITDGKDVSSLTDCKSNGDGNSGIIIPEAPRITMLVDRTKCEHNNGEEFEMKKDLSEMELKPPVVVVVSSDGSDDLEMSPVWEFTSGMTFLKSEDFDSVAQVSDAEETAAYGGGVGGTLLESAGSSSLSEYEELYGFASDVDRTGRDDLRDLADMDNPYVLRRLLMGQDGDLLEMLHNFFLEDEVVNIPTTYPLGELATTECLVCYSHTTLNLRPCCAFPVCNACLETYFQTNVSEATVKIPCPNSDCNKNVHRDEILDRLSVEMKIKFNQFLVDANKEPNKKTCPRCSGIMTVVDLSLLEEPRARKHGLQVECAECALVWCFPCQAPWHEGIRCKDYRRGDKLVRTWARERPQGQINAQRCPNCKVFIERSAGCDHMTCSRCCTHFCYQCGEKFREFKFIGNHYSRLSIFGCKYLYKADKPTQRKLVRGSIFGAKLLAAPVLGGLALGAGAIVAGIGLVALPIYGGYRLHKKLQKMKEMKYLEQSRQHNPTIDFSPESSPYWDDQATTNFPDPLLGDRFSRRREFNESIRTIPPTSASDELSNKEDVSRLERNVSISTDQRQILRSYSNLEGRASARIRQQLGVDGESRSPEPLHLDKAGDNTTGRRQDAEVSAKLPAAYETKSLCEEVLNVCTPDSTIPSDAGQLDLEVSAPYRSKCFEIFV